MHHENFHQEETPPLTHPHSVISEKIESRGSSTFPRGIVTKLDWSQGSAVNSGVSTIVHAFWRTNMGKEKHAERARISDSGI